MCTLCIVRGGCRQRSFARTHQGESFVSLEMTSFLAKRASDTANLVQRIVLATVCASLILISAAQRLPDDEVQVLQIISSTLRNNYWKFSGQNPCNGEFNKTTVDGPVHTGVVCDCTFDSNTTCHVTNILLKGMNLTGTLPEEFANLTYLREIDLTQNYINGTIPRRFAPPRLVLLSLLGNRISGTIPPEIGDIITLEVLVLEDNLLEGNLPENMGNLSNLSRLLLTADNLNGTIPESFGNLRNLTEFRIDGNNMSGRIPDFIGNWTRLTRLDMQGASFEGPIPESISNFRNLSSLRISDLKGPSSRIPNLAGNVGMQEVILRNCSIIGQIPPYFEDMPSLRVLDLSFNMLSGEIPSTLILRKMKYMFLSHNSLTGAVPGWILSSKENIDMSYNNFTGSPRVSCQSTNVNLVASHSTSVSGVDWCLTPELRCPRSSNHHTLFINCGGGRISVGGKEYEEDSNPEGAAHFQSTDDRWALSSTGMYMGKDTAPYIAALDGPMNSPGADFYRTARLAPSSLKYYGICMRKGSYTVRLHFAEIIYSDNNTFSDLGRRIFDVAIQGNVVLPNFDIAKEANGVRKGIVQEFNNVYVNGSTLEVHLYWTGKGTTAVPDRGVYGPLISAIAITPNFDVSTGLSAGAIAGIVVSSVVVVLLVLLVLWKKGYLGGKEEDNELKGLDLQTGYFTLRQIKAATNNFDSANKIGEGGFGPVYKGVLPDGTAIAVKQLSSKSKQGNREFVTEIGMISALQHPNLVKLFGCGIDGKELLLIYEYLENNSLARALFGNEEQRLHLDWPTRKKICIGIARGLAYLHEESRLKIVHRDIKATNILLDKDLNAKISDFGLAKLDEEENTHISTRIAGTIGYMAPEYAMRGYLTDKADVYSFGIVALEIVSGKSNTNYRPKEEFVNLLDCAYVLQEQGNLLDLVDPALGSSYNKDEAKRMLNLALLCANPSPTLRPVMSQAVSMLDGKIPIQAPLVKRGIMNDEMRFKAIEMLSQDSQTYVSALSQESRERRVGSMDGPWSDSSISLSSKDETRDHSSSSRLLPDL